LEARHWVPWRQKLSTQSQPAGHIESIWQRSRGRQVPLWQRSSAGQLASTWQFTGGGITQKPMRHTSFGGQSVDEAQPAGFWQTCVMHFSGAGQPASVAQ
jgi:hypothetical protein